MAPANFPRRWAPRFFRRLYWTADEKDAFFHALARHSALCTDLIAAEIESKTAVDMCAYAALLRGGAQAPETETGISMQDQPAALEMSDRWIAFEEQQAAPWGMLPPAGRWPGRRWTGRRLCADSRSGRSQSRALWWTARGMSGQRRRGGCGCIKEKRRNRRKRGKGGCAHGA